MEFCPILPPWHLVADPSANGKVKPKIPQLRQVRLELEKSGCEILKGALTPADIGGPSPPNILFPDLGR